MSRILVLRAGLASAAALSASASALPDLEAIGYNALSARLGAQTPTGAGVPIGQVEAFEGATGVYLPDPTRPQFAGIAFFAQTPGSVSSHATGVGLSLYGAWSIATGVTQVYCWNASNFIQSGYLRWSSANTWPLGGPPPGGVRVFNHSWNGFLTSPPGPNDVNALRRLDDAINRDDLFSAHGFAGAGYWLLGASYNGIAVGALGSAFNGAVTPPELDSPGRTMPQIVVPLPPGGAVSDAVPVVASSAALLLDTARRWPSLASNPDGARALVLRAAMFVGASRGAGWSNAPIADGPSRGLSLAPLDRTNGVGSLNIDRAHAALTGGEWPGAPLAAGTPTPRRGWSLLRLNPGDARRFQFWLTGTAGDASFLATWNRRLPATAPYYDSSVVADFSLSLWRLNEDGTRTSLVGQAGAAYYTGGNTASRSPVEGTELIRVTGLAAGRYALEVTRDDALTAEPGWEAAVAWLLPMQPCPGDANGDGVIDFLDLNAVIDQYGRAPSGPVPADVNGDGRVDFFDLALVLGNFGLRC